MFKNALISCSNKKGLSDFVGPLSQKGLRVVSTGGTQKYLNDCGIEVVEVSEQTDFPEVMGGRVKTLHPKVHMALLARSWESEDQETLSEFGVEPFDLVVGNLYAFEEAWSKGLTERDLAEFIDVGGPSFLRAAAKNYERIAVICDPDDYEWVLKKGELDLEDRKQLASKVFAHTSYYDSMIAASLGSEGDSEGLTSCEHVLGGRRVQRLRYGENPAQTASWYQCFGSKGGLHQSKILQGKPLSYNNLLDIEAAVATLREFPHRAACVSVKHLNPCGVAVADNILSAVEGSLKADPVSVFGGVLAINQEIDADVAVRLTGLFLECVVVPGLTREAQSVLETKKNLRVLVWPELMDSDEALKYRSISGGFLVQTPDRVASEWNADWIIHGESPSAEIRADLMLAWKVCAHLKSNAIAIAGNSHTLGLGMGQVNRKDAVKHAIARQQEFFPGHQQCVLASDAFFPFSDSIELLHEGGLRWVIQPGGSIKDSEVIERASQLGVNLVLTGQRHFMH